MKLQKIYIPSIFDASLEYSAFVLAIVVPNLIFFFSLLTHLYNVYKNQIDMFRWINFHEVDWYWE